MSARAVAHAGTRGRLRLVFGASGGRTALLGQFSAAPLHSQRALYLGPGGMAHVYAMSSSGGILRGDSHRIDVEVREGAAARVATQGATRIYGMDGGSAEQRVRARVLAGAYLELVPDPIIPYRGSRFRQRTELVVHEGAAAVCSEVVAPGRVAMGESLEYDELDLGTRAVSADGAPLVTDSAVLRPAKLAQFGVLGGRRAFGTAYVLCPGAGRLLPRVAELVSGCGGASELPGGAGLLVRVLGDEAMEKVRQVAAAVRAFRLG